MMSNTHEPTPEFERYLEWQIATALRREDRFAAPVPTGYRRYLALVPIVIASVVLGAAGVKASDLFQQQAEKQLLVQQQEGERRVAQVQVEVARQAAEDARRRAATGVAANREASQANLDLERAVLHLQRVELNLEEVRQSGRPVQDDVTSPLVNGHDFVTDRLRLDEKVAALLADAARQRQQDLQTRVEVGTATQVELASANAEVVGAASDMQTIQEKLSIREQFLAGKLSAEDATRRRLLGAARSQRRVAQIGLEAASKRYEWTRTSYQAGLVSQVDMLKAQLEMLTRQQDLKTIDDRIRLLEAGRIPAGETPVGAGGGS